MRAALALSRLGTLARNVSLAGVIVLLPGLSAGGLSAQGRAARTRVTVDYVSVDGVYLPVGADQGVALGDTVPVYADSAATAATGLLTFVSVTRQRSVAQIVDASVQLRTGDVVFLPLSERTAEAPAEPPAPSAPVLPRAPATARTADDRATRTRPRVAGRISLEVDARETRTSWTGDLSGETRRRFATPTSRLSLVVSDLPGGFELRTSLRSSYRYDNLVNGPPTTSIRAYEVAAVRSFESVPIELMLGRFTNPYEGYSSYWDGALLRIGGSRGPGVGVVAGYEPTLYDEGFATVLPKVTGFADLTLRGRGWSYDTDVSAHFLRPDGGEDWSYLGWSQRISLGPVDLSQRLRVDGGLDGRSATLGDLRLRGGLDVAGPFRVHGAYGRTERSLTGPAVIGGELAAPFVLVPRQEASLGVDLRGQVGTLWLDGGQTTREGETSGRFVSGHTTFGLGRARALLSGRHWRHGASRSFGVSPALAFGVAGADWTVGYRYYGTRSTFGSLTAHAADLRLGFTLASTYRVTALAEHQWGGNLSGERVQLRVSRSF